MSHAAGLEWIYMLHRLRTPALDALMRFLNFFDRQEFFFLLIPILWLCYRWQLGRKIFYLFALSALVNFGLKALFAEPRPFWTDPSVALIRVPGYSFPSGGAQSSMLIAGLIFYHWKTKWKWLVGSAYVLLISLSRVYLGVHFPLDVLGGWAVGLFLWGLYVTSFPWAIAQLKTLSPLTILLTSSLVFAASLVAFSSLLMMIIAASAVGMECGIFFNTTRFHFACPPVNRLDFWLRALLGPGGVFALYFTLFLLLSSSKVAVFSLFFIEGLWISFFSNALCSKISSKLRS